jgi:hypothetical protein
MWMDPSYTAREICEELGIKKLSKDISARLHLSWPRPGSHSIRAVGRVKERKDPTPYRELWLGVLHNFPDLSRRELQRKAPRVYGWLAHNDGAWLRAQWRPPRMTRRRYWPLAAMAPSGTDEMTRDERADRQLADTVIETARMIRTAPGPPLRISKNRLQSYLPASLPRRSTRARFPFTFAAIRQVTETWEDLLVRRIKYVVARSDRSDQPWTYAKLVRATGASAYKSNPRIKQALDDVMLVLLRTDP